VCNLLSKVSFSGLLHLDKNHCGNFLWGLEENEWKILNERTMKAHKIAFFAAIFDMYSGFATLIGDFERPTSSKVNETETDKTKSEPTSV
jgi:hypothetical protein